MLLQLVDELRFGFLPSKPQLEQAPPDEDDAKQPEQKIQRQKSVCGITQVIRELVNEVRHGGRESRSGGGEDVLGVLIILRRKS
jgi:hypothetical protein